MNILSEDKFHFLNYQKPDAKVSTLNQIILVSNFNDLFITNIISFLFEKTNRRKNIKNLNINLLNNEKIDDNTCLILLYDINILFKRHGIQNLNKLQSTLLSELDFIFKKFSKNKILLLNFYNFIDPHSIDLNLFIDKLNNEIKNKLPDNLILIDFVKIINELGYQTATDLKLFYQYEILFSFKLCYKIALNIYQLLNSFWGLEKKVLVLDCDKTLWPFIIGETDEIYQNNYDFKIFLHIQKIIKRYKNEGLILCINSKNNYSDVKNFFENNKNLFALKFDDFVIKKINWNKKTDNIQSISHELNLLLDSFIFIDDTNFEIELMKNTFPEVLSLIVPNTSLDYLSMIQKLRFFFRSQSNLSAEDLDRSKDYIRNQHRTKIKKKLSYTDFIKSLSINLNFSINNIENYKRYSQISQKTNQFNLTTKRFTENEIINFIKNNEYDVFSIDVSDTFGKSGITGLAIIKYSLQKATIDSFILSCRIIGRNIEQKFLYLILNYIIKFKKIRDINSKYIKSPKNDLVANFFEQNFFDLVDTKKDTKFYKIINLDNIFDKNPYIKND